MKYKIARALSAGELEKIVSVLLSAGWHLQGGAFCDHNGFFYQTLVWVEE